MLRVPQYLKKLDILHPSYRYVCSTIELCTISGYLPQAMTSKESLKENIKTEYLILSHKQMV